MTANPGPVHNSSICTGQIHHCRLSPKHHEFTYPIYMFHLDLDEITAIEASITAFSSRYFSPLRFKRDDYLGSPDEPLKQSVLSTVKRLGGAVEMIDRVTMLGQIRCFGFYFSPVNFYFCYEGMQARYMLAEVHNTPWNEMHCYLVNVSNPHRQAKEFHVSPFMGMNMQYQWTIRLSEKSININIENWQQEKLFIASLHLEKQELNNTVIKTVLRHWPMMTLSIVRGIYWQAIRLFIKRIPYHSHP